MHDFKFVLAHTKNIKNLILFIAIRFSLINNELGFPISLFLIKGSFNDQWLGAKLFSYPNYAWGVFDYILNSLTHSLFRKVLTVLFLTCEDYLLFGSFKIFVLAFLVKFSFFLVILKTSY